MAHWSEIVSTEAQMCADNGIPASLGDVEFFNLPIEWEMEQNRMGEALGERVGVDGYGRSDPLD